MTATHTAAQEAPTAADAFRPRRRRWPYLLAMSLVALLLGAAGDVVYRTPLLGLRQIEVTAAAGELDPAVGDAVRAAEDIPTGTPLILLDLGAARRKALTVPEVATAAVSRHWPNDLLITVTQRTPVAVTSANGAMWLLDTTGVPYLEVAASAVPAGLPTVELAAPGPTDPSTLAALAVVAELKAPVRAMVSSVSARTPYTVALRLIDGRTVIWGSPGDGPRKMQILPAVLAQPGQTYDVTDPGYVTTSLK